jgi:hypothetical protein
MYWNPKPKGAQEEMLQEIREGNLSLREGLLKESQCLVWTQEEVEALNYFLSHRDEALELMRKGPHHYTNAEPQLAPKGIRGVYMQPLWVTRFGPCWMYAGLTAKGETLHWISVPGHPQRLAFCMEEWEEWDHSYLVEHQGRGRLL